MKKLLLLLTLIPLAITAQEKSPNTSHKLYNNFIETNVDTINENWARAGTCSSPDGPVLIITAPPIDWQYLSDNGYCFVGNATTSTTTMCFTFTATASNTLLNAGFSESCNNNSFGPFQLYDVACNPISTSLNPTGLTIGADYIWCITMRAWAGPGCTGYTTICPYFIPNDPLPIELIEFKGDCKRLYWSTASEINNDYFLIEESIDGKVWREAGKVNGVGNSIQTHNYSLNINPKELTYYRLSQHDFDGNNEVFKSIAVYCNLHNPITGIYNTMGQYIKEDLTYPLASGIYLVKYDDGSTERVFFK